MALLHRAELHPTKLELLTGWLPTRSWYPGPTTAELSRVGAYRFDDPAGQVGIETMLVRAGDGPLVQAPLTYRDAPLPGREAWLIGTTEHSVLGRRWVYDGCGDPLYVTVLADIIGTGAGNAEEFLEVHGELRARRATAWIRGSGAPGRPAVGAPVRIDDADPTRIVTDSAELIVPRILDGAPAGDEPFSLTGTWDGQAETVLLAYLRAA
jgi:Maltokinase N-terminal cap domain